MKLLTIQEIVTIHDSIIQETGGSLGVREPGLLAAISEKPRASFGGKDLYPTVFDKAAAIFEAICNYHVFIDGNKRTGIASLEYVLFKNGLKLSASAKEKENFTLHTATTNPDLGEVAAWIKRHAKKASAK